VNTGIVFNHFFFLTVHGHLLRAQCGRKTQAKQLTCTQRLPGAGQSEESVLLAKGGLKEAKRSAAGFKQAKD